MKRPTILIDSLDKNFNVILRSCKFFYKQNQLFCSDIDAVDYYGVYRGGYPWIHPSLEAWAEKKGGYWEWEDPESICFAK